MGVDTSNIFAKCTPAFGTNIESCGALTACSLDFDESGDLASLYGSADGSYKIHGNLLYADFVGKVFGKKEHGLYDFFQATKRVLSPKRVKKAETGGGTWEIEPFLKMEREKNVNNNYWEIRVKDSLSGYNQTDPLNIYAYSTTGIPVNTAWFHAGMRIFVSGRHPGSGDPVSGDVIYRLAFKVTALVGTGSDSEGSYIELTVSPQNASSVFASKSATLQEKSKLPTGLGAGGLLGLGVRGTANINDFEAFCSQVPGLNPKQMIPFWIESNRYSICDDELTNKYVEALRKHNPYFKQFADVETVKYNQQIIEDYQKRHANSLFFNKPLANQTLALWEDLEQVTVPSTSALTLNAEGRCVGRKANAIGLYEQLAECDRVVDLQGEDVALQKLFNTLYYLKQNREGAGVPADIVEIACDSRTARKIARGIIESYKTWFGSDVFRLNHELSAGAQNQGPFGFRYMSFPLQFPNIELRIITNKFFDDLYDAHKSVGNSAETGRYLWILDWASIYKGVLDSNSQTNKSGDINQISAVDNNYMCVMKVPQRSVQMFSETFTLVVETENTSIIFENIGDDFDGSDVDTEDAYLTA